MQAREATRETLRRTAGMKMDEGCVLSEVVCLSDRPELGPEGGIAALLRFWSV